MAKVVHGSKLPLWYELRVENVCCTSVAVVRESYIPGNYIHSVGKKFRRFPHRGGLRTRRKKLCAHSNEIRRVLDQHREQQLKHDFILHLRLLPFQDTGGVQESNVCGIASRVKAFVDHVVYRSMCSNGSPAICNWSFFGMV